MTHHLLRQLFACAAVCAAVPMAQAQSFTELVDAGITMPTAITLPAGTTTVNGTITPGDYDLFRFTLALPQTLTLHLPEGTGFDPNLLLFNGLGQGLAGDDDNDEGVLGTYGNRDSVIRLDLAAGTYFVGVGPNNMAGFTDGGVEIFANDAGTLSQPTSLSLGYVGNESTVGLHAANSRYTLSFSVPVSDVSAVPEPSALAMGVMGLACLAALQRRKVNKAPLSLP